MQAGDYQVNDRRPIAARRIGTINRLAQWLARNHVSANAISMAGMLCGILAGVALWRTASAGSWVARLLWLAAAGLVQLRLLANLLDGMVAIASQTASQLGELFNEAPDRVSDTAILIGLGYAAGGQPILGWCAALLALWTAYVRLLGKTAGTGSDFRGPMAKQHRMFFVTVVSLLSALAPSLIHHRPAAYCLAIICIGCLLTVWRRFAGVVSTLRNERDASDQRTTLRNP